MDVTRRLTDLRAFMDKQGIDLSIIMHPENQYYLSGFKAIIYSRPISTLTPRMPINPLVTVI